MRRLIRDLRAAGSDRGATIIVAALVMTVLLGFAGLAVDLGASFAKRAQLQNGADAAVFALAQKYAASDEGCTEDVDLATQYVRSNVKTETPQTAGDPDCLASGHELTVTATDVQEHWFMPVFGRDSSPIGATATVEWGSPVAGSGFPLTFSECVFESIEAQAGDLIEVWVPNETGEDKGDNPCAGRDYPAGGFGWLKSSDCQAPYADISDGSVEVPGETGNSDKTGCDWSKIIGSTVLIPIFNDTNGVTGNGQAFYIYKFASFELLGVQIHTGGRHGFTSSTQCKNDPDWGKWKKHCVYGKFVEYVSVDDAFKLGPVAPGDETFVVRLTD